MNKGFTLIEVLVVMFILTVLGSVFSIGLVEFESEYFNPKTCQLKAMATKEKCQFNKTIRYNENGNINHAQTFKVNNRVCIFQLGMGRYRCE